MTKYFKIGNTFRQASEQALNLHDKLPGGTYVLKADPNEQFYYELADNFVLPKKIYGDALANADRIIKTFFDRPNSTGVLLDGEKGSGKTLLTKMISSKLVEQDVPTIIINTPFVGDKFNSYIQEMEQEAVILFDEFEKVYEPSVQPQVLTLLDGVFPTKKLFLLTCNDKYRIDSHMRNRPGRLYYMLSFTGLERSFIEEYALENLTDKTHLSGLINSSMLFGNFNFDMLQALVEEMNRYGESAQDAMKILNTRPDGAKDMFDVKLTLAGEDKPCEKDEVQAAWHGNPFQGNISLEYEPNDEDDYRQVCFKNSDLTKLDAAEGKYHFTNEDGDKLLLTRRVEKTFDYSYLL